MPLTIDRDAETAKLKAARAGDRRAFDSLIAPHLPLLHKFLLRILCQPADAEDIAQETLLTAFQKLDTFRGEARFQTWLFGIATRKALDVLRNRKRWPIEGQIIGEQKALASPALMQELVSTLSAVDFVYEYRQHVAYCFSCVTQTLEPELAIALMLREIVLLENQDAADAMTVSESKFRHFLSQARQHMSDSYEGLCALIGKSGVCYQCNKLRDLVSEEKRGPMPEPLAPFEAPPETKLNRRLAMVREADLENAPAHRVLLKFMSELWAGSPS